MGRDKIWAFFEEFFCTLAKLFSAKRMQMDSISSKKEIFSLQNRVISSNLKNQPHQNNRQSNLSGL